MSTYALKDARMELKTTKEAKDFLNRAAILAGVDLSAFLITSAMEKARVIVRDHSVMDLSFEGQTRLVELLANTPAPTEAMKELRNMPRLKVRE